MVNKTCITYDKVSTSICYSLVKILIGLAKEIESLSNATATTELIDAIRVPIYWHDQNYKPPTNIFLMCLSETWDICCFQE